jgi:hypothetical protein
MKKSPNYSNMRKSLAVFILIVSSAVCSGLSYAEMNIIGEWSGIDSDGDSAIFVFGADKSAELEMEGIPRLSAKNLTNGSVEWSSNTDYDPVHLDIIIMKGSQENGRIPMITQIIDDQTMKIQISRDMETRPNGFEITQDVFQIVLTKQ